MSGWCLQLATVPAGRAAQSSKESARAKKRRADEAGSSAAGAGAGADDEAMEV